MTRDEVKKIVLIIKKTYPNWQEANMKDDKTFAELLDIWAAIFRDDDYKAIEAGLFNYIQNDTSGFAPAPGQIRSGVRQMAEAYDDTEDAIAELRRALKNSNYGYREEFAALSPSLQRAVGQAENLRAWAALPTNELESVALSHVRRAYRNIKQQEKQLRTMLPIGNEALQEARKKLNSIEQKPMEIEQKPIPARITEERKAYEPQLTDEEREAVIDAWNRKGQRMILTTLMISPKRDQKLREWIDREGLQEILSREARSEAQTFGAFLEELDPEEVSA